MASSNEDFGPVVFLLPSLTHICLTKVATTLQSSIGLRKLQSIFSETQSANSQETCVSLDINDAFLNSRAKEFLLLIPSNLKKALVERVIKAENQIQDWVDCHEKGGKYSYYSKCSFFWRSEGTIDRIKTAQGIVRNENIDIRARFQMACLYSLSDSVETLWKALESNREKLPVIRLFEDDMYYFITNFWVTWLSEGAQYHWTKAAIKYHKHLGYKKLFRPMFSTLFREMMPEERGRFFKFLVCSDLDDLRMCLHVVTKEERKEIMGLCAVKVLLAYLKWPLTDIFLDQADKTWEFLSVPDFVEVLDHLLELQNSTDVDYKTLTKEFWKRSPDPFKECSKTMVIYEKRLSEFIEKMIQKNSD